MITHGCGATWTGARRGHCGGCHRTFSSETAFQQHRAHFTCRHPMDAGLKPVKHPWGICWSLPGSDERWADS